MECTCCNLTLQPSCFVKKDLMKCDVSKIICKLCKTQTSNQGRKKKKRGKNLKKKNETGKFLIETVCENWPTILEMRSKLPQEQFEKLLEHKNRFFHVVNCGCSDPEGIKAEICSLVKELESEIEFVIFEKLPPSAKRQEYRRLKELEQKFQNVKEVTAEEQENSEFLDQLSRHLQEEWEWQKKKEYNENHISFLQNKVKSLMEDLSTQEEQNESIRQELLFANQKQNLSQKEIDHRIVEFKLLERTLASYKQENQEIKKTLQRKDVQLLANEESLACITKNLDECKKLQSENTSFQKQIQNLQRENNAFIKKYLKYSCPLPELQEMKQGLEKAIKDKTIEDKQCIICCDNPKTHLITPCGHSFCQYCIQTITKCALCKGVKKGTVQIR